MEFPEGSQWRENTHRLDLELVTVDALSFYDHGLDDSERPRSD